MSDLAADTAQAIRPRRSALIQLQEQADGSWSWDARWAGPPPMRSAGSRAELAEVLGAADGEVLAMA
jgi:hypothetical protein